MLLRICFRACFAASGSAAGRVLVVFGVRSKGVRAPGCRPPGPGRGFFRAWRGCGLKEKALQRRVIGRPAVFLNAGQGSA